MDIEFTEEQKILQDSVERMLLANYDFNRRREIVASEEGRSRALWQKFADLGLFAAPFSEQSGGLGGGPIATMIIMEAFGRHLVAEPFFETVVLAGGLIESLGSEQQRQGLLADIIGGRMVWATSLLEAQSRDAFHVVSTTANGKRIATCSAAQRRWWLPGHGPTSSSFPPGHRGIRATGTV